MSVLFIGKRFYTNRDALREKYGRIYQLPRHWSRSGVATKLWLVDYHDRTTVHTHDGALEVLSTPVRNLALFWHWLSGAFARDDRPELVVASGDCYIGWLGLRVARRLRARFAFDVYDKYDEFAGYHRPFGLDLFGYLLRQADVRMFAGRALLETLGRSITDCLVPNGLDVARFRPRDMSASRTEMHLPQSGLLVGYFGGMEPDRGVADLLAAVMTLREQGMDVQLVLGGNLVSGLDVHSPGALYLGNVPYDRMPYALAACDLLAVPYRRSPFMDVGSSNKIAEAIACGRPLVATRTPNLIANFPSQAHALDDLLAAPGDPASLARSIRLQSDQRRLVDLPEGMAWFEIAQALATRLGLDNRVASVPGQPA